MSRPGHSRKREKKATPAITTPEASEKNQKTLKGRNQLIIQNFGPHVQTGSLKKVREKATSSEKNYKIKLAQIWFVIGFSFLLRRIIQGEGKRNNNAQNVQKRAKISEGIHS